MYVAGHWKAGFCDVLIVKQSQTLFYSLFKVLSLLQ